LIGERLVIRFEAEPIDANINLNGAVRQPVELWPHGVFGAGRGRVATDERVRHGHPHALD
jgi:hypothetical protein